MPEKINGKVYLSVRSIAKELDCSTRTVQHYIQTGKIEAQKLFGRLIVERKYFEEWKRRYIAKKEVG